jgi:DNA-directed RNA polymerase specialized sigma24 family protein
MSLNDLSAPDPARLQQLAARVARCRKVPGMSREDLVQETFIAMLSAPAGSPESHLVNRARSRLRDLRDVAAKLCANLNAL